MNTKKRGSCRLKALSKARQTELQRLWDMRLRKDPLVFVPNGKRKGLSPTEARKRNTEFGEFSAGYVKKIFTRLTGERDMQRRLDGHKIIMAVGYGRGYDSKWLRQATEAGFQTWWVEISSVAWIWMTTDLGKQFEAILPPASVSYMSPEVRIFEIQSMLANPKEARLDVRRVEIWYLCRLLNCLSTRSAKAVLQEIGRTALGSGSDPHKRKAVVIINALSDHNPSDTCCGTSIIRSKNMIIANLGRGAGRTVEPRFVESYQYFDKVVTAMTIMAR